MFAVGVMIWVFAAQHHIVMGEPRESYVAAADGLLGWVSTRSDWVPYQIPPVSLAERFRAAIGVEIFVGTEYATNAGYCE